MSTLYLIPVPLAPDLSPASCLPPDTLIPLRGLTHFVAENAKSARTFLKAVPIDIPIQQALINELNEHTPTTALPELLMPLQQGFDLGLLSEAGCPAVADPGAALVDAAHAAGFRVKPLTGPSSLLLALMASGLCGQNFAFHGYLPVQANERQRRLRELENESRRYGRTQIFIETPYRNDALFAALLTACHNNTRLAVACDLTRISETIAQKTIAQWKTQPATPLGKRPTVFLLLAA